MISRICIGFAALVALPLSAMAEVALDDLPGGTVWYFHADFERFRTTPAGQELDKWLRWEVYDEIEDELGIDLNKEVNQFTAFSDASNGAAIIIEGPLTKATQEKIMSMVADKESVEELESDGNGYYHVGDDEKSGAQSDPFEPFEDTAYFSFALQNKLLITGTEGYMQELLGNSGKVSGMGSHNGALMVLSANQSLVQAGMHVDGLIDEDDNGDWESNIVRNTEQAALLVADESGMLAIEAQLVSTDPKMAQGIAGIINGLIALQSFSTDIPAEVRDLIANTKVEINDNVLSINTVIDPDLVVSIINN